MKDTKVFAASDSSCPQKGAANMWMNHALEVPVSCYWLRREQS